MWIDDFLKIGDNSLCALLFGLETAKDHGPNRNTSSALSCRKETKKTSWRKWKQ